MNFKKEEKELSDIIHYILLNPNEMFYGLFLSEINIQFSTIIPTACLGKKDSLSIPFMYINPDFWNTLNYKQRRLIIIHELMHYINSHWLFSTEFGWEHKIANVAMDLHINQEILKDHSDVELPEGGLLPNLFPELKLKLNESSSYYYNELLKAKKKNDNGNNNGNGENDDLHPLWKELEESMTDVEKEILKREMQSQVERIIEETVKNGGKTPINISSSLQKIKKQQPIISWKRLFRLFIASSTTNEIESNKKKVNNRFPDMPGYKYKTKVNGVFLADSSGSVSNEELEDCNKELYNVYKAGANIDYASWDEECEIPVKYNGKLELIRTKSGGTNITSALEMINQNYKKKGWNFAVITTDGHTETPLIKAKIPTLIIITKEGMINKTYPHKQIKMN
jgi:predicted metal-dependent peptidase